MSQSLFTGFQASLFDPLDNLPADLRKDIETGWASDFRLLVLPEIVRLERMFAPLYSSRRNTRPSTPTYILLSLLVLQLAFGLSDRQVFEKIHSDLNWQYAIGTETLPLQPISRSSLTRFRSLCTRHRAGSADLFALFGQSLHQKLKKTESRTWIGRQILEVL